MEDRIAGCELDSVIYMCNINIKHEIYYITNLGRGRLTLRKSSIVLSIAILLFSAASAATTYSDIEANWARDAIRSLAELNIFDGIYTEAFQPNRSVTREEMIELAARCFGLTTAEKQALYSWLDHLMPMSNSDDVQGDYATRAELVAVAAKILGLADQSVNVENWYPTYEDIDRDHPLFAAVELANKLDILPTYVINRFEPDRLATRAGNSFPAKCGSPSGYCFRQNLGNPSTVKPDYCQNP